jgi:ATP-binding cassette subfamily F protein uup
MRVLMKNPNFLILDEPTNDLDIDTLNVLEDFLLNYPGVIMLVSHDRYLIDKLTEQLFIFDETSHVRVFNGNYTDYRLEEEEKKSDAKAGTITPPPQEKPAPVRESNPSRKLSFKEQKELEDLESRIANIEESLKGLTDKLNSGISDHQELTNLSKEVEELNSELEMKTLRWIELSELKEI